MTYEIKTKIVGVTFSNSDGTSRQDIIRDIVTDSKLSIEHEPHNEYDSNSHIIKNSVGSIIGHVRKELAKDLIDKVNDGEKVVGIKYFNITGGEGNQSFGMNICIEMMKSDEDDASSNTDKSKDNKEDNSS